MDPPLTHHYTSGQRGSRGSCKFLGGSACDSGVATALEATPLRCPVREPFHMLAILPGKMEELAGGQIGGFFSEERFKAPPHIGALPRLESITTSCVPVVPKCLEHFLRARRTAQPSSSRL